MWCLKYLKSLFHWPLLNNWDYFLKSHLIDRFSTFKAGAAFNSFVHDEHINHSGDQVSSDWCLSYVTLCGCAFVRAHWSLRFAACSSKSNESTLGQQRIKGMRKKTNISDTQKLPLWFFFDISPLILFFMPPLFVKYHILLLLWSSQMLQRKQSKRMNIYSLFTDKREHR